MSNEMHPYATSLQPMKARGEIRLVFSRLLNVALLVIVAFMAGVISERTCPFIHKYTGGEAAMHRCTCGCEVTGQCKCPNCSAGCGYKASCECK